MFPSEETLDGFFRLCSMIVLGSVSFTILAGLICCLIGLVGILLGKIK
jgi:hypothetical protein